MEELQKRYQALREERQKQKIAWEFRKVEMKLEGITNRSIIAAEKDKYLDPNLERMILLARRKLRNCQPEVKKGRQEYYLKNKDKILQQYKEKRAANDH